MVGETITSKSPSGFGEDLRALRKARGTTLVEMAQALNRSVGWLSQMERGLSTPTIRDVRAVARIFDVPISFFMANDEAAEADRGYVVRAACRRALGDPEADLSEELLSPDLGGGFEMLRSTFAPGARSGELVTRATEEAGYILSGRLDLYLSEKRYELAAGDSFRFRDENMHWHNPGSEPAVVIWVISPPVY